MKTICFIIPSVYGYFSSNSGLTGGGAERQLYLLSQELKESYDVHFVVDDFNQPATERRQGVTLHRAVFSGESKSRLNILRTVFSAMRNANADVYIDRNPPRTASITYTFSRLIRSRWIYNIANDANISNRPESLSVPFQLWFRHAVMNADAVIAQTEHQTSLLNERYNKDSAVVPNGYPLAESVVPHDKRTYFLWVGRLSEEQKQPHLFLDLAESLPEYSFVLVGPADNDEYHQQILDREQCLENVRYDGPVDPEEIYAYYEEAIALVNTSAFEGFPNTFLEAWRVATPVISLNVPHSRLTEDANEFGYANGDSVKMKEITNQLAEDRELCSSIGFSNQQSMETSLEISEVASQYKTAIESIMDC